MPRKGSSTKVPCVCVQCDAVTLRIPSQVRQFCSNRCAGLWRKRRVPCICLQCGASFTEIPSRVANGKGRFCSFSCRVLGLRVPLDTRFWRHVDKNGPIPVHCPELGPCWIWTGRTSRNGYGLMAPTNEPGNWFAHRVSWLVHHGDWPVLNVCHHCDNPSCVRPSHLFEGTHGDNSADMVKKWRVAKHLVKLTRQQVEEIRAYTDTDVGANTRIGLKYGVLGNTIRRVRKGESWAL